MVLGKLSHYKIINPVFGTKPKLSPRAAPGRKIISNPVQNSMRMESCQESWGRGREISPRPLSWPSLSVGPPPSPPARESSPWGSRTHRPHLPAAIRCPHSQGSAGTGATRGTPEPGPCSQGHPRPWTWCWHCPGRPELRVLGKYCAAFFTNNVTYCMDFRKIIERIQELKFS